MRSGKRGLRSVGGLVGIVVAVAGGFGAAVGLYSLPDPQNTRVFADAYARVDEHAIAVHSVDAGDGFTTTLRIDISRGGSAGANALVPGDVTPQSDVGTTWFQAALSTCDQFECTSFQEWSAAIPSSAFFFSPTMDGASFSGEVDGCQFDVSWTAEGTGAPFAGVPEAHAQAGPEDAEARENSGYGEVSRVAPADISTCFTSVDGANGYLSVGLRRELAGAGYGPGE